LSTIPRSTPARNAPATLPSPPTTATIRAKVVRSKPAVTVSGALIDRVTATSPARPPLSAKISVRTSDGLIPTSRAPVSSWITDRTPRPKVVRPKKSTRTPATPSAITEAQTLPAAIGTPPIEIGSPPTKMYSAPVGYFQLSSPTITNATPNVSKSPRRVLSSPVRRYTGRMSVRSRSTLRPAAASIPVTAATSVGAPRSIACETTIAPKIAISP
jgi:hypothetical protein